ncbi:MAG: ornithine cyclodeaminase family protein [Lachnospiraceae bacterium]|nr:ornithine cyclodeaminase family protein [Lachnospiraceae bacterium]
MNEQNALIIGEETVKKHLSPEDIIDCVEKTWKWYGEGKVIMPNKITTDMSSLGIAGWFNSMPAYIGPMDVAGVKIVGGYDGNKSLGLPYIKANLLVTDSKTGILRAVISGDYISDMRTGAQPAIMAKLLASKTDVVTIIGTGLQGYTSLLCMSKILSIKEVRVCDISEKAKENFISRFPNAPWHFVNCKSNEEGCRGADVIITVTNANADLVEEPWVKEGALVMTMGSFRETSFDVVRKADKIAVDQVGQSLHRGNVKELAELGEITAESFDIIIPDVLAGKMKARTNSTERIYAQIIGTGMLDVACAGLLLEKLSAQGIELPSFDMTK